MHKRYFLVFLVLLIAFTILLISVLRVASLRYEFKGKGVVLTGKSQDEKNHLDEMEIDYPLVYPGSVLPDHILWPLKAFRDKLWIVITPDVNRKSELNLLFADKRLSSAIVLFGKGEYDVGFSTLTKAEKYLEEASNLEKEARGQRMDTSEMSLRLIKASFRHRSEIKKINLIAPEDAKPKITEVENYAKRVYREESQILHDKGIVIPNDPFNGE